MVSKDLGTIGRSITILSFGSRECLPLKIENSKVLSSGGIILNIVNVRLLELHKLVISRDLNINKSDKLSLVGFESWDLLQFFVDDFEVFDGKFTIEIVVIQ